MRVRKSQTAIELQEDIARALPRPVPPEAVRLWEFGLRDNNTYRIDYIDQDRMRKKVSYLLIIFGIINNS